MGPGISLLGMAALIAVAVALSKDRRAIRPKTVASAFGLLVAVAVSHRHYAVGGENNRRCVPTYHWYRAG